MDKPKFEVIKNEAIEGEVVEKKQPKVQVREISETPVQLGGDVPELNCIINNKGGKPTIFTSFAVIGRNEQGMCTIMYCDLLDLARGLQQLKRGMDQALAQASPDIVEQVRKAWEEEG